MRSDSGIVRWLPPRSASPECSSYAVSARPAICRYLRSERRPRGRAAPSRPDRRPRARPRLVAEVSPTMLCAVELDEDQVRSMQKLFFAQSAVFRVEPKTKQAHQDFMPVGLRQRLEREESLCGVGHVDHPGLAATASAPEQACVSRDKALHLFLRQATSARSESGRGRGVPVLPHLVDRRLHLAPPTQLARAKPPQLR